MPTVYHALGLHMHQPSGNIELLLETNEWEAKQIILCYERPLKYAMRYEDGAKNSFGFFRDIVRAALLPTILDSSTTKEEFLRLAKAKLREYKNPWIEDTLQSILNLAI